MTRAWVREKNKGGVIIEREKQGGATHYLDDKITTVIRFNEGTLG